MTKFIRFCDSQNLANYSIVDEFLGLCEWSKATIEVMADYKNQMQKYF
ncbi:hypothetical protein ACWIUD_07595 [Helicobacter sp. 23-1044]